MLGLFRWKQCEGVNDEVRWSLRTGSRVQIPSGAYLSRVDREFFHYAGRWSVVISGTVKSAVAADLIAPGFMATLMVHLALTRLDRGIPRRAFTYVCARQYGNILLKTGWVGQIEQFDCTCTDASTAQIEELRRNVCLNQTLINSRKQL